MPLFIHSVTYFLSQGCPNTHAFKMVSQLSRVEHLSSGGDGGDGDGGGSSDGGDGGGVIGLLLLSLRSCFVSLSVVL